MHAFSVLIHFSESKIDHIQIVLLVASANEEVIRLYVSVNYPFLVYLLYYFDELNSEHQTRFEVEKTTTLRMQVF